MAHQVALKALICYEALVLVLTLPDRGNMLLMILHTMRAIMGLSDRIVVLHDGAGELRRAPSPAGHVQRSIERGTP